MRILVIRDTPDARPWAPGRTVQAKVQAKKASKFGLYGRYGLRGPGKVLEEQLDGLTSITAPRRSCVCSAQKNKPPSDLDLGACSLFIATCDLFIEAASGRAHQPLFQNFPPYTP